MHIENNASAMNYNLPFYSVSEEKPASEVYHTHPQCRVAQRLEPGSRIAGTGEGRRECPFCFVLGQLRSHKFVDMPDTPTPVRQPSGPGEFATAGTDEPARRR